MVLGEDKQNWQTLSQTWISLVAQMVKILPEMQETCVQSLCWEDTLERGTATHFIILSWRILWTEESLLGCSPWGHKELKTSEWLNKLTKLTSQTHQGEKGRRLRSIKLEMKKEMLQQKTQKYVGSYIMNNYMQIK